MDRMNDDPRYHLHGGPDAGENPPPDINPPTPGEESDRSEDSFLKENRRLNMQKRDPEAVRETEREHHTPTRPDGDLAV
ncbi:MAG TPA: hypothetical protein VFL93_01300 [Longimicrobiaceae bacterium]|nr:hypothetical protein [Longimicrobiaceae bacterium]